MEKRALAQPLATSTSDERQMNLSRTALTALCFAGLAVTSAHADNFGSGANQFIIDFVSIGDPGNPVDTGTTGSYFSSYGAVGYTFQMGKYEVSRDMITKANATVGSGGGGLGITLNNMTDFGGNIGTHPATGMSWNEAARFVNWLNTSQSYAPAYKFTLQPGDGDYTANANIVLWQVGDTGYDASNPYRNSAAHYFLPSENEWYKAAYYSGSGSTYYDYATQQNAPTTPTAVGSGTAAGSAVYGQSSGTGPANIDQAGGLSHYGTMGQNGNVWELQESAFTAPNDSSSEDRAFRGGNWDDPELILRSSFRFNFDPTGELDFVGFRVASVPEPSCAVLMLGSGLILLARRRRERSL